MSAQHIGAEPSRLEHDRHIGFEPFKQKRAANGPARNQLAYVMLARAPLRCCSVQCTRTAGGHPHRNLIAAHNFGKVYMGYQAAERCVQQTHHFGDIGTS